MPTFRSKYLNTFSQMHKTSPKETQDSLWRGLENPTIEDIPDQTDKLVTFLYQLGPDELDGKTSIYFLSGVTGYDFSEKNKFSIIPQTDIAYISLVLPCELRGAYNLVKLHDEDSIPSVEVESGSAFYPKVIGESAKFSALLDDLFAKGRVETDSLNKKEIIYYKDMDTPGEYYGKESILELPMAPHLDSISTSYESVKSVRDRLRGEGRLIDDKVQFSETSLRNEPGYNDALSTRKYWVYLPKDYNPSAVDAYPFMLFLDGSSYLDYMPAHCILEQMIKDQIIPPCVAVFFDSADGLQRSMEYNCNAQFTEFLTRDFMETLRGKHGLHITTDPDRATIVGASASGLAAFYTGLTKPEIFGHVIAQSPDFVSQPLTKLDRMILDHAPENSRSSFIFELGRFENYPIEYEFEDGTVQNLSSSDVVDHVCEQMRQQNIPVDFHEIVGGHNYVCFRVSLYERIKEVYQHQLAQVDDAATGYKR